MKHQSLRYSFFIPSWCVFPTDNKVEYSTFLAQALFLQRASLNYFSLNRNWIRKGQLYSHTRVHWSSEKEKWNVYVYYVLTRKKFSKGSFRVNNRQKKIYFFLKNKIEKHLSRWTYWYKKKKEGKKISSSSKKNKIYS